MKSNSRWWLSTQYNWRGAAGVEQLVRMDKGLPPITTVSALNAFLIAKGIHGGYQEDTARSCPETLNLLRIVVTTMLTSVECERGFSLFKRVFTRLRNRLKDVNLDHIMIIAAHCLAMIPPKALLLEVTVEAELLQQAAAHWSGLKRRRLHSPNYNSNPYKRKVAQKQATLDARTLKATQTSLLTSFTKVAKTAAPLALPPPPPSSSLNYASVYASALISFHARQQRHGGQHVVRAVGGFCQRPRQGKQQTAPRGRNGTEGRSLSRGGGD
jgi:hypothetical protein